MSKRGCVLVLHSCNGIVLVDGRARHGSHPFRPTSIEGGNCGQQMGWVLENEVGHPLHLQSQMAHWCGPMACKSLNRP